MYNIQYIYIIHVSDIRYNCIFSRIFFWCWKASGIQWCETWDVVDTSDLCQNDRGISSMYFVVQKPKTNLPYVSGHQVVFVEYLSSNQDGNPHQWPMNLHQWPTSQVVSASRSPSTPLRHGRSGNAELQCSGAALFGAAGGFGRSRGCGSGLAGGSHKAVVPGGFQGVPVGGWKKWWYVNSFASSPCYTQGKVRLLSFKGRFDFSLKILWVMQAAVLPTRRFCWYVCHYFLLVFSYFDVVIQYFKIFAAPRQSPKT